jgi:hypothetical protein
LGGARRTCPIELQSDFAPAAGLDEQLEVPRANVPRATNPRITLPDTRPVRTLHSHSLQRGAPSSPQPGVGRYVRGSRATRPRSEINSSRDLSRRIVSRCTRVGLRRSRHDSDPFSIQPRRSHPEPGGMEFGQPLAAMFRFLRGTGSGTSSRRRSKLSLRYWPFLWCSRDVFGDAGFFGEFATTSGDTSR